MTDKIKTKTLIVEDDKYVLRLLKQCMDAYAPKYIKGFAGCDEALAFVQAKTLIESNDYKLVLLDHFMPRDSTIPDQEIGIGYKLIPIIRAKNPSTIIIGTSSSPPTFYKTDHWIDKRFPEELENILKTIK